MFEKLEAAHFEQLQGSLHTFHIPDGSVLRLRVDAVTLKPKARNPFKDDARVPFTVCLTALAPTPFIEGLCAVEFPGLGRVENIMVSRQATLGRDAQLAYFQIIFN